MILVEDVTIVLINVTYISFIQIQFQPALRKGLTHDVFVNAKSVVKLGYGQGLIKEVISAALAD